MKKTSKEIISQIRALLDELEGTKVEVINLRSPNVKKPTKATRTPTGCIGAIQILIEEGFLDELRTVQQIVTKLKEEGQPYSRELVSMNLLNLVKPRHKLLRRINDQDKWKYIVRR